MSYLDRFKAFFTRAQTRIDLNQDGNLSDREIKLAILNQLYILNGNDAGANNLEDVRRTKQTKEVRPTY